MRTREWAALHWLVLCCTYSFAYATADLPIDTVLRSSSTALESQAALDTHATLPDSEPLPEQDQAHLLLQDDMQILWPMMPKETLAKLAHSFYPNSPILAQRFIQKSVRLSRALGVHVDPNAPFQHAQIIAIPNEKEVRALTHRIKKTEELTQSQEQLKLSYQLKQIIPPPAKPLHNSHHTTIASVSTGSGSLDLPEFQLSSLKFPSVQSPTLETLTHTLQRVWHNLFAKVGHGIQSAQAAISDWSRDLLPMQANNPIANVAVYAQTNMFKIVLGIGLTLMMGLLGWALQKRHLQRKVALLNTIETTLIEPTISDIPPSGVVDPDASAVQSEHTKTV
ncbi:MAG: hypothetical protein Q7V02_06640 [Methylophilus sp.]|nr:hypothetical protein [Methylophilus sp.]